MKNIFKIIFIHILFSISLLAQQDQVSVTVEGLGCPFCAFGLEKKFKKVDGIKKFRLDIETGVVTFKVPADNDISVDEVEALVLDAGYSPMAVTIDRASGDRESVTMELPKAKDANAEMSFHVSGNCDMCKTRIERTVYRSGGVSHAEWNRKSKMLNVKYNDKETDQDRVEGALAQIGYDTENMRADDGAYDRLPKCCHYKRKKIK